MISYTEAFKIIESEGQGRFGRGRVESLPLLECIGRHSTRDICTLDSNPRFDNSAMDGFAVVAQETLYATSHAPVVLKVVGCLGAGEDFSKIQYDQQSCIEIMTGAKVPNMPYDAVIRLEDVEVKRDETGIKSILVNAPVKPGENIRFTGEDFRVGEGLFPKGRRIDPQYILALSMSGYKALDVFIRPKIAILSTGNEIVSFDSEKLLDEEIRNSTTPLLIAALSQYGADIIFHKIVCDDAEKIRQALLEALEEKPDIIITTGGVSAGKYDLVALAIRELGFKIHFHKVAVRPGKPIMFGEFLGSGQVLFGLPGNPVAVAIGIRFFVYPYMRSLLGERREVVHKLPLTQEVYKPPGLTFFQRGVRDSQGVRVLPGQASFMVKSLLKAEGWIVGAPESEVLKQGELVEWYPLW